ncbi:metalloregulator ArsR/SmtB family transcription factor [Chthonomonas sp.]|uniref:ArsR/SmtB family transcription factor n=1 Tax=Chthonomonas sp. TaxID=2282153 RepID=UPI002B4B948D|nr:metalloregulator ArsR/SmtB family transcription factor [Chthonomonas sp.]
MECQADSVPMATSEEALQQRTRFARLCKALGHPARLQILQFLATVPTCFCGDIVKQLPLAQSTVSQHLKILKEAGWIQGEIEGPRTCYWLNRETLAEFRTLAARLP